MMSPGWRRSGCGGLFQDPNTVNGQNLSNNNIRHGARAAAVAPTHRACGVASSQTAYPGPEAASSTASFGAQLSFPIFIQRPSPT